MQLGYERVGRIAAVVVALIGGYACGDEDGAGASGGADASGSGGSGGTGGVSATGGVGGSAGTGGVSATGGVGGEVSGALNDILTASTFASMFLHQGESACNAQGFTHAALITAAADFPRFGNEGSEDTRRREVAAFLANISHETTGGWATAPDGAAAWGLCFREEVGCSSGGCTGYCDASNVTYPCTAGVTYHGRGPMQLSWNYNYGRVGAMLGLDLLTDPSVVVNDPVIGWKTALWFWMTPQTPKPSAHDVMTGAWTPSGSDVSAGRQPGFGMTVNIINGGLECGIANDHRVEDRVSFLERYAAILGTTPGDNLRCDTMQSY